MYVKFYYDEKTTEIMNQFQKTLDEYEDLLMNTLNNMTITDSHRKSLFLNDAGRILLTKQIGKIQELSIPIRVEIVYKNT